MKKAPEAFRTISEVAEILGTPAHVLRFWESKFYQIRPVKRAGGRRYYRPDDVALINGIRFLLQEREMTIRGVQRVLQDTPVHSRVVRGAVRLAVLQAKALEKHLRELLGREALRVLLEEWIERVCGAAIHVREPAVWETGGTGLDASAVEEVGLALEVNHDHRMAGVAVSGCSRRDEL